ncbi:MAG: hypothetical protein AAGG56_05365 [Pseudomonadota bacterium]
MTVVKYRNALPQLSDNRIPNDGGIETTLFFRDGPDLPMFAAFPLLETEAGRMALRLYYESYIQLALDQRLGFILDSATWRANRDYAALLPLLPNLRVFGGCCGTDHRHVCATGHTCLPVYTH